MAEGPPEAKFGIFAHPHDTQAPERVALRTENAALLGFGREDAAEVSAHGFCTRLVA